MAGRATPALRPSGPLNGGGGWRERTLVSCLAPSPPPKHSILYSFLPTHLELEFHASDVLAWLHLRQLLDVGVEAAGRHLRIAAAHGLQQGLLLQGRLGPALGQPQARAQPQARLLDGS